VGFFNKDSERNRHTLSLLGFVSSNLTIIFPLYIFAKYWFNIAAFACPICKYPLGSGGKRVTTCPSIASCKPIAKLAAVLEERAWEAFAVVRALSNDWVEGRVSI
jgi:hypothetical protein